MPSVWLPLIKSLLLLYGINLSGVYSFVPRHHVGLKFGDVVIAQHDGFLLVVIFEEGGKEVASRLAFRVAHGEDGCIGTFGHELVLQTVSTAVSAKNAVNLPPLQSV